MYIMNMPQETEIRKPRPYTRNAEQESIEVLQDEVRKGKNQRGKAE